MLEQVGSYKQTNQIFRNNGNGKFSDITSHCGEGFGIIKSSRGVAFGDYDNDGDVDILIANINESPDLLRNDNGNKNNWLTLKLIGSRSLGDFGYSNRDAIGAKVKLIAGGMRQTRFVKSGSSYACQSDMRLSFGLGNAKQIDNIEILWPSGLVQRLENISANQQLIIIEGEKKFQKPQ